MGKHRDAQNRSSTKYRPGLAAECPCWPCVHAHGLAHVATDGKRDEQVFMQDGFLTFGYPIPMSLLVAAAWFGVKDETGKT